MRVEFSPIAEMVSPIQCRAPIRSRRDCAESFPGKFRMEFRPNETGFLRG